MMAKKIRSCKHLALTKGQKISIDSHISKLLLHLASDRGSDL